MFVRLYRDWRRKKDFNNLRNRAFEFLFDEESGDEWVVFDTETTGLNPKVDDILSIGAVKIKGNKILTSQTFEVFIKSDKIDKKSIEVHGIRPIDVQNGKSSEDAIKEFLYFIGS
ncbi:MAG: 3'-5' exonuclease, partial [Campylobacterales bacterium]|nr:3'-5' exonuclease [Campylobacterales bacterium]